ncbi:MAG TPA: hypothetical protein VGM37_04030 [Armatimonadota bacterium]|jgi:hypothetical protein
MHIVRLCLPALLAVAGHATEPAAPLVKDLVQFAGGKPVPIVAVAAWDGAVERSGPPPSTAGKAWLPALQAIAEGASTPSDTAIPFGFGAVWTIAPDEMTVPSLPIGPFDPLTTLRADTLFPMVAASLTPEQMEKASAGGLTWNDWTVDQQRLLTAAFSRPGLSASTVSWAGGVPTSRATPLPGGALPIWRARVRLGLAFRYLRIPAADGGFGSGYYLHTEEPRLRFPSESMSPIGYDPPITSHCRQTARLKPQGIAFGSAALSAPIGVSGSLTVAEVVKAAAAATGLSIKVDPHFAGKPAFVGDSRLRAGDVMKALAFDLSAAWRRIGRHLYLAWDMLGFAAFDTLLRETAEPVQEALRTFSASIARSGWVADAFQYVAPRAAARIGPTPEQVAALARVPPITANVINAEDASTLPFSQLTSAQQAAIRAVMPPIEPGDLQRAVVGNLTIEATVQVPGLPPMLLGENGLAGIDAVFTAPAPAQNPKADWPPKNLPGEGSIRLPQPVRALAPTLLTRGEWPRLLEQMRRKGLNCLYFPVLWDGHATFPCKAFPLAPEARGVDLLAEVATRAKPLGIRVVGVVHTLAWRFPGGGELHWLHRHPEMVDVDAAGRTRREWATPERLRSPLYKGADWAEDPLAFSDMADPTLPAVRSRLLAFCAELRAHGGLDGVALAHWTRGAGQDYPGSLMPMLGYTIPARAAFLEKRDEDIADTPLEPFWRGRTWSPFGPADQRLVFSDTASQWRGLQWDAEIDLVDALEDELRKTWIAGVSVFYPYEAAVPAPLAAKRLEADTLIASTASGKGEYQWLPAPKPVDPAPGYIQTYLGDELAKANENRAARAAIRLQRLTGPSAANLAGVVLDFTTGPDLMWDALRLVAGP